MPDEAVQHHLVAGLRSIKDISVTEVPFIGAHNRQNDIRVVLGDDKRPLLSEDYDLKVITLFAATHQHSLGTRFRPAASLLPSQPSDSPPSDVPLILYLNDTLRRVLLGQAKKKIAALPSNEPSD